MEHFVTLFDSGFLLQGLALHRSLQAQGEPFVLWVVCMDAQTELAINALNEPDLKTIALSELEALEPRLLTVKPSRSRGEYCWTLTPFTYRAVMEKTPSAERITYVDADLYFFGPASNLLKEMDSCAADVLITEHAFAPQYRQEASAGVYCVQFVPFRMNPSGLEILRWWQDRCIEWCYARLEDGKFGDQKYLDDWAERWHGRVRVLQNTQLTLAPWNVDHFTEGICTGVYHFHSLRVYEGFKARLWEGYQVSRKNQNRIYGEYVKSLRRCHKELVEKNVTWSMFPAAKDPTAISWIKRMIRIFLVRKEAWAKI